MMSNAINALTQNHESIPMKKLTFCVSETMIVLALTAIQSFAQSTYEPYTFTTLAGGRGFVSPDRVGRAMFLYGPNGVAVDSSGNLYVADTYNQVIYETHRTHRHRHPHTIGGWHLFITGPKRHPHRATGLHQSLQHWGTITGRHTCRLRGVLW